MLINLVEKFGYIGIAFLVCIENIFPPIPSEIVLGFGGFLTTQTDMLVWATVVAATIGTTLGALILYGLGRLLPKDRIINLFDGKIGSILHLKPKDILKAEEWFVKYEYKAVFLCRFIPIVRSLVSIPAGMSKMKLPSFLLLTIIGTGIWNTVLIWMGAAAGEAWKASLNSFGKYTKIALVIVLVVVFISFIIYMIHRKDKDNK